MSISSELKSFLLSMRIEAPESTTNIRSSVFLENVALSSALSLYIFLAKFHAALWAYSSCREVSSGETSARKDFAHEVHLFG